MVDCVAVCDDDDDCSAACEGVALRESEELLLLLRDLCRERKQ